MSYTLFVGFKQTLRDLEDILRSKGFTLLTRPDAFSGLARYTHVDLDTMSTVEVIYREDLRLSDVNWKSVEPGIVSQAKVSVNADDVRGVQSISNFLKTHYGAVLYDPQQQKRVD